MTSPITRPVFSVATRLIEKAAELYELDPWELPRLGAQRINFQPRFATIWVLRELGKQARRGQHPYTYQRIAGLLGFDDHTSALYAHRRAEALRAADPKFRAITDQMLGYAMTLGPQIQTKAA